MTVTITFTGAADQVKDEVAEFLGRPPIEAHQLPLDVTAELGALRKTVVMIAKSLSLAADASADTILDRVRGLLADEKHQAEELDRLSHELNEARAAADVNFRALEAARTPAPAPTLEPGSPVTITWPNGETSPGVIKSGPDAGLFWVDYEGAKPGESGGEAQIDAENLAPRVVSDAPAAAEKPKRTRAKKAKAEEVPAEPKHQHADLPKGTRINVKMNLTRMLSSGPATIEVPAHLGGGVYGYSARNDEGKGFLVAYDDFTVADPGTWPTDLGPGEARPAAAGPSPVYVNGEAQAAAPAAPEMPEAFTRLPLVTSWEPGEEVIVLLPDGSTPGAVLERKFDGTTRWQVKLDKGGCEVVEESHIRDYPDSSTTEPAPAPTPAPAPWPTGVTREDYNAWKNEQHSFGITENVNPQEFKRLRDAGLIAQAPAAATLAEPQEPPTGGEPFDPERHELPTFTLNPDRARLLTPDERRDLAKLMQAEYGITTQENAARVMTEHCGPGIDSTTKLTVAMREQLIAGLEAAKEGIPF